MFQTRRTFLSTAVTAAGVASLFPPTFAHASIQLGDVQIDSISDGFLTLPGSFFFDPMPQAELLPLLEKYGQPIDVVTRACNVTLLRTGNRTILFDVGSGTEFAPNVGDLLGSLDALDVAPEDITDVVFTHAHPDHLWGLLDDFDDLLFTHANYMIGKDEWDYWLNPNTVSQVGEARAAFAVGAKRRLEIIEDKITFFNDGEEILPGVAARASFGHTPGHMAFEVRAGSDAIMIVGDCISDSLVAFERPDWHTGADQDQETAALTRKGILDQMATDQMGLVGFHLEGNGVGRVERKDGAFRFVSES